MHDAIGGIQQQQKQQQQQQQQGPVEDTAVAYPICCLVQGGINCMLAVRKAAVLYERMGTQCTEYSQAPFCVHYVRTTAVLLPNMQRKADQGPTYSSTSLPGTHGVSVHARLGRVQRTDSGACRMVLPPCRRSEGVQRGTLCR